MSADDVTHTRLVTVLKKEFEFYVADKIKDTHIETPHCCYRKSLALLEHCLTNKIFLIKSKISMSYCNNNLQIYMYHVQAC